MKIYYVFDPLCVFCYGFHPLIEKLYYDFKEKIEFEILPGGLWVGDGVKQVNEQVVQNLRKATDKISNMSSRSYGDAFFSFLETNPVLDSFYGSKAMVTALSIGLEEPFKFIGDITKAVFVDGSNPSDITLYEKVALDHQLPIETFRKAYSENDVLTNEKFRTVKALGATSYPTVLCQIDNEFFEYPLDYTDYKPLYDWVTKLSKK